MIVVSLFDGIACGLQALKQAGITVCEYHAFETDKHAIRIATKNHPEIIHHGNVENFDFTKFRGADLLIGGPPCQGFSLAGRQLGFNDPRGKMFFEFKRAKLEIKPKNFILENVPMKKKFLEIITFDMGANPVMINSALVSAQNRKRYYWCNKPITQPADKNILLKDILEYVITPYQSAPIKICFDGDVKYSYGYLRNMKHPDSSEIRKKSKTVRSSGLKSYDRHEWDSADARHWRKFTPLECERLQTLPDNYTEGVSDTQRYKMIGNCFTVSVIKHILKELFK